MTKSKEEVQAEYSIRNKMEAEMVYNLAMYIAQSNKDSPDSLEYRFGAVFTDAINKWFTDVWLIQHSGRLLDALEISSEKKDWLEDKYGNEYRVFKSKSTKTSIIEYRLAWGCRDESFVLKYAGSALLYIMRNGIVVSNMCGAESTIQTGYLLHSVTNLEALVTEKNKDDE